MLVGLTRLTGFSLKKGNTAVFSRRDVTTTDPIRIRVAPFVKGGGILRQYPKRVSPGLIKNPVPLANQIWTRADSNRLPPHCK